MPDAATPMVMIVGEDSEFVYLMQRYVSQRGYSVSVAHPGSSTVDTVREKAPVAILVDIESPQAKGWDILRMLKADRATCDIPVVICSWLDEETHSLQEGATAHLQKPVMYDDVLATLQDVCVRANHIEWYPPQPDVLRAPDTLRPHREETV